MADLRNDVRASGMPASGRNWATAIAESTEDAIIGVDLGGHVVFWNRAAATMFDYLADEILGRSISLLIPVAQVGADIAVLDKLRRGETVVVFETERQRRDGTVLAVAIAVSPIRDEQGAIIGISQIMRDCSEARRSRLAYERQIAVLASVFATTKDGLVVINDKGAIDSFSQGAEHLFGFAAAEMTGRNVNLLMPSPDREAHDGYLQRYHETGEARIIGVGRVVVGQRKDGSVFPLELSIGRVDLPGERLYTGVLHDMTEHQEDERRLQAMQAQLIRVTRLAELDHMASNLAHEVNQPLTAMSNYLAGAKRLLADGRMDEARAAMDLLSEQTERARVIVQRVRGMVKNGEATKQVENLAKTVEEATAMALVGVGRDLRLTIRIAPEAREALIDKVQIQQVLLNLIRNAIEAMDGAAQRELDISARRVGAMVEIRVADTGPGLADGVRDHLFEPFTTTKPDGLGMGLSISRAIVDGHGGKLRAEDGVGGGTVFCMTVPTAPGT